MARKKRVRPRRPATGSGPPVRLLNSCPNEHFSDLNVSRETQERLETYVDLLLHWNRRVNLVSKGDIVGLWERHVFDSLQLVPLISSMFPSGLPMVLDLGSGAGFPGIVLAIAEVGDVHLVEANRRKAAFLAEAARRTDTKATIHSMRIEALPAFRADVITARALAPLSQLLAWSRPLLKPDGFCLFPKGRNADHELTAMGKVSNMSVEQMPSRSDPTSTILRIAFNAP